MNKFKTIKAKVIFSAPAKEVYDMLMDSKKHTAFTGSPAKISKKVGGKFSVWDGYAWGKNLELVEGGYILQEWEGMDFPEGHKTLCEFKIKNLKNGKSQLDFTHKNVPEENFQSIKEGWNLYYFNPMREFLRK